MAQVVRGMDRAMESMNPERVNPPIDNIDPRLLP
jgi:hypothetical protein